jgi:voltage-gated potassium channel
MTLNLKLSSGDTLAMQVTSFYERRFTILLVLLICFLLATPVLLELVSHHVSLGMRIVLFVISTMWVASATFAVSGTRKTTIIAVVLMAISLLLEVFNTLLPSNQSEIVYHLLRIVFILFIIHVLFKQIFSHSIITFNTISASICIYLLMGALWGNIFSLLDVVTPGAIVFNLPPNSLAQPETILTRPFHMLYFSFVTLSTVGYGDMVPVTIAARMFAATEAVVGQIYLLVMVSRLVGMQISQAYAPVEVKPTTLPQDS